MKKFIIIALAQLALFTAGAELPEHVKGVPQSNALLRRLLPTCPENKIGPHCGDCNTLMYCFAGEAEPVYVACDSSKPYCVDDKCSATPRPHDSTCDLNSAFFCTRKGYVPDPKNCGKYYYCDDVNGRAVVYTCPEGYSYDVNPAQAAMPCKRLRDSSDCATINCTDSNFGVYPADESFYGLCDPDSDRVTVFRCQDELYERFNLETNSCVVTCPGEGVFPDRLHCDRYYQCYYKNGDGPLVLESKTCSLNMTFNPDTLRCENTGKSCNKLPTTTSGTVMEYVYDK